MRKLTLLILAFYVSCNVDKSAVDKAVAAVEKIQPTITTTTTETTTTVIQYVSAPVAETIATIITPPPVAPISVHAVSQRTQYWYARCMRDGV